MAPVMSVETAVRVQIVKGFKKGKNEQKTVAVFLRMLFFSFHDCLCHLHHDWMEKDSMVARIAVGFGNWCHCQREDKFKVAHHPHLRLIAGCGKFGL
jgi:hypothetical protein